MNSLNDMARAVDAIAKNQEAMAKVFAQGERVSTSLFNLAQIIGDPSTITCPTLDEVNARRGHA